MSKPSTLTNECDKYGMTPEDWKCLEAMTEEEVMAAALSDPDAQPISPERLAKARRAPLAKVVRHKLRLSREEFSAAYGIPRRRCAPGNGTTPSLPRRKWPVFRITFSEWQALRIPWMPSNFQTWPARVLRK